MRVNVISDLHLEFEDLVLPGGDILILSGDVCEATNIKDNYDPNGIMWEESKKHKRPDRFIRFFKEECTKYRHVIYVMGNHEHYHGCYDDTYNHIKQHLPSNVYLLENEVKEIDDVVFIGCTLWTDANKGDPITKLTLQDCMSDYHTVQKRPGPEQSYYGRLSVAATVYAHKKSKKFIQSSLEEHKDKKCVVVTHHAPSQLSVAQYYKNEHHMNGGYFSNLDNILLDNPNLAVWTHGHTHYSFDYTIGNAKVICNPRGYKNYEQRADDFDPTVGFDI